MNWSEQRRREDATKAAAFTLVELLVTLTVVGILLALLLPAVTRSKAKAKEAVCTGNLRQVYSALHLYLGDNGGRFPAGFLWSGRFATNWNSNEFIGGRDGRDTNCPPARLRPLFPYMGASEAFRCPFDVGYDVVTKGVPTDTPCFMNRPEGLTAIAIALIFFVCTGIAREDQDPPTEWLTASVVRECHHLFSSMGMCKSSTVPFPTAELRQEWNGGNGSHKRTQVTNKSIG